MNTIKKISILSFSLLTACAPRPMTQMDTTPAPTLNQQPLQSPPSPQHPTQSTPSLAQQPDSKLDKTTVVLKGQTSIPSSWDLSGAIAARSKNKSWTASINWLQQGANNYQIRLSGPLGGGTVLITKQGGMVNFRDGSKSASSSNATALLQQQTGVSLPVSSLYYWVRGIPAPGGTQAVKRDASNHILQLQQNGYTIDYGAYTTVGGRILPSQIRLQGNGVFIKLVVRQWKI